MSERRLSPLAKVFPDMSDEEFAALVADIREYGLREPITVDRAGDIIDGRHRYRACLEAGVEPRFTTYDGGDPRGFVVSMNMRRRQMTPSQLAMVADNLARIPYGSNQHSGKAPNEEVPRGTSSSKTQVQAAKEVGASVRSVKRARKVREKAAPEVSKAVEAGKLTLTTAEKLVGQPVEVQQEVATAPDPAAAAKKVIGPPPPAEVNPDPEWPEDREGNPLPDREEVRQAFADAALHDAILEKIKGIRADITALIGDAKGKPSKVGGYWTVEHRPHLAKDLKNLAETIKATRPHGVCPYCKGNGEGADGECQACKSMGWLVLSVYDQAPESMRQALKSGANG